jgi:predicted metal-dependent HD superfamily phosphohydrolase
MDDMCRRWLGFCERAGANGDVLAVYGDLASRYGEPHRAYHTMDHVAFCLGLLDGVRDLATRPNEVEMALWFHDVVYDPHAHDNETRSAALARETCRMFKLPGPFGKRVHHLIAATRHRVTPTDADARLVVDIDLAVLGQPPEVFDDYERRIRREYATVEEGTFWLARVAVLREFLARPRLYATAHFHDLYEGQARSNLSRSIGRSSGA